MKLLHLSLILTVAALLGAVAAGTPGARADQPEIVRQFPADGAVLDESPPILHLCFKDPVDVRDLPPLDEGDFEFPINPPGDTGVGARIVFQPDGYGVQIHLDVIRTDYPDGDWVWGYRVVDRATLEPLEGEIKFSVASGEGDPVLPAEPTPMLCLPGGATTSPSEPAGQTPTATPGSENGDDSDAPVLLLVVIGVGVAIVVLGVIGFIVSRRRASGGGPGATGGTTT
jgi:hypothetical protein